MSETDPRLSRLLSISHPSRPAKVVGVLPERSEAVLLQSAKTVVTAMSRLTARSAEVHASGLLPSEKAQRLQVLRPDAIKAVHDHQRVVAQQRARIEQLAKQSPVPTSASLKYHEVVLDAALWTKLASMTLSERTQLVARAIAAPNEHRGLVAAVLRADRDLLDLQPDMVEHLRQSAMDAFMPDVVASIEQQEAQLEIAARALEMSEQTLQEELPGSLAELRATPDEPVPPAPSNTWTAADMQAAFDRLPDHIKKDFLPSTGAA